MEFGSCFVVFFRDDHTTRSSKKDEKNNCVQPKVITACKRSVNHDSFKRIDHDYDHLEVGHFSGQIWPNLWLPMISEWKSAGRWPSNAAWGRTRSPWSRGLPREERVDQGAVRSTKLGSQPGRRTSHWIVIHTDWSLDLFQTHRYMVVVGYGMIIWHVPCFYSP